MSALTDRVYQTCDDEGCADGIDVAASIIDVLEKRIEYLRSGLRVVADCRPRHGVNFSKLCALLVAAAKATLLADKDQPVSAPAELEVADVRN